MITLSPVSIFGVKVGLCFPLSNLAHHSGYIGGMKETPAAVMMAKNPEKAMMLAVKGMLPHTS